ncbi:MAG: ATP-binding protein [Bacillota bacterium]|nr:ATP-binding protein [Bacillota bacterium]
MAADPRTSRESRASGEPQASRAPRREMPARVRDLYARRQQAAEAASRTRRRRLEAAHPELAALERRVTSAAIRRLEALGLSPAAQQQAERELDALRQERRRLLAALGEDPASYDAPAPLCPHCGDTGYDGDGFCRCYPEVAGPWLLEQSGLPDDADARFPDFDAALFAARPRRAPDGSPLPSVREERERQCDYLLGWCAAFPANDPAHLYLSGPTGTGKTWFAQAIGHRLIERGYGVLYLTAPDWHQHLAQLRRLTTSFGPDPLRLALAEEMQQRIETADCLILDDLGTENVPPATRLTELLGLLNQRLAAGRPLVISSNLALGDVRQVYDERVSSRLIGAFQLLDISGDDVRLTRRRRRLAEAAEAAEAVKRQA